jgi:hypothetical protein
LVKVGYWIFWKKHKFFQNLYTIIESKNFQKRKYS